VSRLAAISVLRSGGRWRWYIVELGKLSDGSSVQMVALCHDRYVRTTDGWRLERRRVERIYKGDAAVDGWVRPTVE